MFSVWEVGGITVLNTVKLLDAVLAQELGALCRPQCCQHCVVSIWSKHCVRDTVLAVFWTNIVRDTVFGDAVGTKNMRHRVAPYQLLA